MQLIAMPRRVATFTPEQLRRYMASEHDREFALIDVREPCEFATGHIAGAINMPLSALDERIADAAKLDHKNLIFYCWSGTRSARASEYASRTIGFPHVFHLAGGMQAWSGHTVVQIADLRPLEVSGSVSEIVWQALELEKGAHRLYDALLAHFAGSAAEDVIEELARAETAHGRTLYDLLASVGSAPAQPFEVVFDALDGDLVEGGESYDVVLGRAREAGEHGSLALLELALEIELRAYDVYKSLSERAPSEASRAALDELAHHEKRHADALLRKIDRMAAERMPPAMTIARSGSP